MGIRIMRANGSRFERTSLGIPWRDIVAACDVKLLFNWLYVSPVRIPISTLSHDDIQDVILTVDGVPEEDGTSFETTLDFVNPLVIEVHPCRPRPDDSAWLSIIPETAGSEIAVGGDGVKTPLSTSCVAE